MTKKFFLLLNSVTLNGKTPSSPPENSKVFPSAQTDKHEAKRMKHHNCRKGTPQKE